jgi:spoIIIJ-associated protein
MDFSEKWGRDVDEAVELALKDLQVERDQVKVNVLEEPSKGFFGIGSKLAKVRVQKLSANEIENKKRETVENKKNSSQRVEPSRELVKETKNSFAEEPNNQPQTDHKETKVEKTHWKNEDRQKLPVNKDNAKFSVNIREKPENLEEVTETPALDFLREVTSKMGLELSIKAMANEECLYLEIAGKDSGTIIGKRGQTLDSIQYLTSLVVNKDKEKYIRVIVDAENYREKREKTLSQLANRLADKVQRTGKSVRLEPMNPYERKVIHATLQKNSAVTTRSEGEEPYRRVMIERK